MAARKAEKVKVKDPSAITVQRNKDESEGRAIARTALCPSVQAALTIRDFGKSIGELELMSLVDELRIQIGQTVGGDWERTEAMLTTQAHTLDAIFGNLARRAISSDTLSKFDAFMKLGLRAQSQSRATWETLAVIKNPVGRAYVGQANFANNQQINNEAPSRTWENEKSPTKLSEKKDVERMDSGALKEAIRSDQALEAVGAVDWPKDT